MKNKLKVKMIFLDIDGTLTNSNKELTNITINTLNKISNKGIKIVLCTGRSNSYVLNLIKKINSINYVISSNGTRIFDIKNNNNIFINKLNYEDINNIWNYSNINELGCILVSKDISYYNNYTDITSKNNKNVLFKKIDNISYLKNKEILQIIVESKDCKKMHNLEKYLNNFNDLKLINYTYDYLNKDYCFFDIVNRNINKGVAIKTLLNHLKINKNEVMCFGDSVNDLDMFNECDIRIAMGNAIDDLKNIANYITDTNDNDGISKFLDNYIE